MAEADKNSPVMSADYNSRQMSLEKKKYVHFLSDPKTLKKKNILDMLYWRFACPRQGNKPLNRQTKFHSPTHEILCQSNLIMQMSSRVIHQSKPS